MSDSAFKTAERLLELRKKLPEENQLLTDASNLLRRLTLKDEHIAKKLKNAEATASRWKLKAKRLQEELNF